MLSLVDRQCPIRKPVPRGISGSAPAAARIMVVSGTAQAPSIAWPHTRMTLPVTALEAGLAK